MADALLSPVLKKLGELITDQIEVFWGANNELDNLGEKLEAIRETMKIADGLPYFEVGGLKNWLQKLKDVTYDAEDIIDEYQSQFNKMEKVCNPLCNLNFMHIPLRYKLGRDIKAINDRLAQIAAEEEKQYKLLEKFPSTKRTMTTNRATHRFIDEKDIIGRESDEEVLIEKLVGEDKEMGIDGSKVSIISIQGIGGVGKTTLAKMLFNDDRVKKHFGESKWWIYIGQKPTAQEVIRKVLEEVKKDGVNVSELNTRTELLHPTISNVKFLLVLDDIWDLDWWEKVKTLVKGAPGSKIVITTRNEHISHMIRTIYVHKLEQFKHEKSWELFLKHALNEGETEEDLDMQNLKDIGRVIVEKCGGLPLAVETIGKLMQSRERTRKDWELIAKSKIWDLSMPSSSSKTSFLPSIILSYDDLPSHLKRYFAHISSCPKGYSFEKRDLIMHYMAHGLVENADEENIEVVAKGHINELIGRCLIQESDHPEKYPDVILHMHDIIQDLAREIAGKEYNHSYAYKNTRHLTVDGSLSSPRETGLEVNNVLRTLIWADASHEIALDKYFNNSKRLRVLDLGGGKFTKLPDSVGNLLLLKHLDLTHTKIKELPASIAQLQNLLSMFLDGSEIKELCKEIGQLRKLRHLSLEDTPQLEFVAEGLGELTCLRTLSRFIVCCTNGTNVGCNIKELKKLNKLSGKLTIENLERVIQIDDAKEARLQEKQHLESLELAFGKIIMIHEGTSQEEEKRIVDHQEHLLQHLSLPPYLKSLALTKYRGKKLPEYWFDGSIHLETLKLVDCWWIQVLPSFSLKCLCLCGCRYVRQLPLFPKLESIELENLDNWEGFGKGVGECLKSLKASTCPLVKTLPLSPKLESIELENLYNWEGFGKGVGKCLKSLKATNCPKLKRLPHFPTLQRLEINSCDQLSALQEEEEASLGLNMPAIIELEIWNCPALLVLPSMPILKTLNISKCENWDGWSFEKENDAIVPCLSELEISNCPRLGTLPCFPDLIRLEISWCEKVHAPWKEDELPIGLQIIEIFRCPNMRFQVNWLLPLTKIQSLKAEWSLLGSHVAASHISAQRLQILWISDMPGQNPLPEWLWQLSGLLDLVLSFDEATSLQGSWQSLKQLRNLTIVSSPELITLEGLFKQSPDDSGDQPTDQQSYYPSYLTHFCSPPKLETLLVKDCPKLKLLPDGLQRLVHLDFLGLKNLPELESLPQSVTSLPKLDRMFIESCPKLKSLPDGLQHLVNLKTFVLLDLPELDSLPQSVTSLPKLQEMMIAHWPKLKSLPDGLEHLVHLENLVLWDLPELESLPQSVTSLPKLKRMSIEDCPKLASLPAGLEGRLGRELLGNCPALLLQGGGGDT